MLRLVAKHEAEADVPSVPAPASPALDDAQLLAAIHTGDEHAASELHDRLRPRVDATIRSLLGPGHSEHDDLAQQSFIELVLSLERYRGECSLETWAATIAARTVFKYLRRRTTERKIFRESCEETLVETSSPTSFRRQVMARNIAARIRVHLEGIEPAKAEAFLLHDVCGFDAREVAGIAGISEAAAHARIARGRRELHEKLAADPDLSDALTDMEVEP
ncbi:MAG: RNA polymerase sigma factor [Labilithrix sp.]|nr:RNA polymerase sigma factor [Labilithrix sp.]MBX3219563.1 RNA polymerase sigma factor [Labilithrix sp.]